MKQTIQNDKEKGYMAEQKAKGIIKTMRLNKGMTQAEVAHLLGVSVQAVKNWEEGRHKISARHLRKLEEVLGRLDTPTVAMPVLQSPAWHLQVGNSLRRLESRLFDLFLLVGRSPMNPDVDVALKALRDERARLYAILARGLPLDVGSEDTQMSEGGQASDGTHASPSSSAHVPSPANQTP